MVRAMQAYGRRFRGAGQGIPDYTFSQGKTLLRKQAGPLACVLHGENVISQLTREKWLTRLKQKSFQMSQRNLAFQQSLSLPY